LLLSCSLLLRLYSCRFFHILCCFFQIRVASFIFFATSFTFFAPYFILLLFLSYSFGFIFTIVHTGIVIYSARFYLIL
jgi:hypothetical protein